MWVENTRSHCGGLEPEKTGVIGSDLASQAVFSVPQLGLTSDLSPLPNNTVILGYIEGLMTH